MRPFLLLCVTFLNLVFNSTVFAQAPQELWEGYRSIPEAQMPSKLKDFAQSSVFQMISMGSTNVFEDTFTIIDPNTEMRITDPRRLDTDFRALQIETCYRQNLRKCPVTKNIHTDTLFLNKEKYYSCRHLFHNWLQRASTENNRPIGSFTPPIIIRNSNLQIIYNSGYHPLLKIDFIQTNAAVNVYFMNDGFESEERKLFKNFDFVQMSAPQIYGTDSNLAEISNVKSDIQKTNAVYLFGYPSQTQAFVDGVGDTPGNQLMVSHGLIDHSYKERPGMFKTSNFNSGGISGGPLVTEDGLILGIQCTRNVRTLMESSEPSLVKSTPYPLNVDFLEKTWEKLGYPRQ